MEDIDEVLQNNDQLFRVVHYELIRFDDTGKSDRLFIFVSEGMNGERKGKFFARPQTMMRISKSDYIGRGNSIEEALRDCLAKVKGASGDEILEKL